MQKKPIYTRTCIYGFKIFQYNSKVQIQGLISKWIIEKGTVLFFPKQSHTI